MYWSTSISSTDTCPYLVMDFLYMSSLLFSAPQSLTTTTEVCYTHFTRLLYLTRPVARHNSYPTRTRTYGLVTGCLVSVPVLSGYGPRCPVILFVYVAAQVLVVPTQSKSSKIFHSAPASPPAHFPPQEHHADASDYDPRRSHHLFHHHSCFLNISPARGSQSVIPQHIPARVRLACFPCFDDKVLQANKHSGTVVHAICSENLIHLYIIPLYTICKDRKVVAYTPCPNTLSDQPAKTLCH